MLADPRFRGSAAGVQVADLAADLAERIEAKAGQAKLDRAGVVEPDVGVEVGREPCCQRREALNTLREVLGWDLDFIVHCHNEWDVPTAIRICQAAEEARPLWVEDPLQVWFSEAYKTLRAASPVRICTGEKIEGYRDFLPFIVEGGIDVLHPDLCWCGGISGGRKIAELADHFGLPVSLHNCGTVVHNMANVHFGSMVRNFGMSESRLLSNHTGSALGGIERFDVVDGKIAVPTAAGLGVDLVDDVLRTELKKGEPYWD